MRVRLEERKGSEAARLHDIINRVIIPKHA